MSKVAEVMISTSGTMPGKTLRIDRNAPVKIKAVGGVHYVLKDVDADVSPENVTLERVETTCRSRWRATHCRR